MKRKVLLIPACIMLLTYGMQLKAQDDSNAKTILDGVSATMKAYSSMKIEFTYTMVNTKTNVNDSKSGVIQIKGAMYNLVIGGQTVFCDGKTVWTYIKDDNEVSINNVSVQEDAINPTTVLNNYSVNFKPKWIKDMVDGGKSITVVDLTPLKGKSYYKVRMNIDKMAKQIVSTTVYDKNGTTYTYKVNNFTTNLAMVETLFTFNKASFPGVEVNDMR